MTKETKEIITAETAKKVGKTEKNAEKKVKDAAVANPKEEKVKKGKDETKKKDKKDADSDDDKKKEKKDKKKSKDGEVDLAALFANKEKSSTQKSKAADEIDELFAAKKPSTGKPTSEPAKRHSPPMAGAEDEDFTDSRGLKKKRRPTTAEGFPIYTATEMRVGQGGDTPDCPFDCQCCF